MVLASRTLDLFFFGANILRITKGGWAPLIIALGVGFIVVGAVTIHRTNNPRSESKSRY